MGERLSRGSSSPASPLAGWNSCARWVWSSRWRQAATRSCRCRGVSPGRPRLASRERETSRRSGTAAPAARYPSSCRRHGGRSRRHSAGQTARSTGRGSNAGIALGSRARRPYGVCADGAGRRAWVQERSSTRVRFYRLEACEIADYLATGEPLDKAGAYGIQGRAASLVEAIEGDFYTVMGLPLARVVRTLRGLGFTLPTTK